MLHSNVNEGYRISEHSLYSSLGINTFRATGLVNENGPLTIYFLVLSYFVYVKDSATKWSFYSVFSISFLITLVTGSKSIVFYCLSLLALIVPSVKWYLLFILSLILFIFINFNVIDILLQYDFAARIDSALLAFDKFSGFGIGFQFSTTESDYLERVPQDFISYNSLGIGIILTGSIFLLLLYLVLTVDGLKSFRIVIFIALMSTTGSLSSFIWTFFYLVLLVEEFQKSRNQGVLLV